MNRRVQVEREGSRVRLTVEGASVLLTEGEARALALSLGAVSHAEGDRYLKKARAGAVIVAGLTELLRER